MKKLLIAVAALSLLCAPLQAQGFLSKLKEKAEQAAGGRLGNADTDTDADDSAAPQAVTGEQALPPRRASTFGWDGPVKLSSAQFPIPLMNEFPAVPSAAELANPVEEKQIAYYKAIKAVTLRAEELNESKTCEDSETLLWREKANQILRDTFGLTDREIQMLQDENLPEAERERLNDKIAKAFLGDTDVDALEQKAARMEKMSDEELMAAYQRGEMNDFMKVAGNARQVQGKLAPVMEMEQKLSAYFAKVQKLVLVEDTAADAKFSAADRKRILALKEQIYATDNAAVYNPLYLQALEIIKSYRERAAKAWAADVEKRFKQMKTNLSELIKLNRQAIADGLLPECALWRLPLNIVISSGDILAGAYSDFPSDYPPMYQEEVVREISLSRVPGGPGRAWFPEFSVFSEAQFDEIAAGRFIFASNPSGEVYQFNAGSWTKLSKERITELNDMKTGAAGKGNSWTSSDGQRTVTFNAEGGYFVFPEGDEVFLPHAWKATPDKIQWLNANTTEDGKYQLILCTYKL